MKQMNINGYIVNKTASKISSLRFNTFLMQHKNVEYTTMGRSVAGQLIHWLVAQAHTKRRQTFTNK